MWLLVGGWGGLLLAGLLATRVFGRGQKQQLDVTADELAYALPFLPRAIILAEVKYAVAVSCCPAISK